MRSLLLTAAKWVLGTAVLVVPAAIGFRYFSRTNAVADVPTAEAKSGEFVEYVELRGQIKALKSVVITGPFSAGDLQIVKLAPSGTRVEKGDVIVQFDTATTQRTVRQLQSDLKQAEADMDRARAQARLQEEKTLTELTQARYDVERARLDVETEEVVTFIDAGKNRLALDSAKRRLQVVETRLQSDRAVAAADLASKQQKRDKVRFDLELAQRNLSSLTLVAPVPGTVNLLPNYRAASMMSMSAAPEFKPGDRAWPGAGVAELPDLSAIQVLTLADELGRSRLAVDQDAAIAVDAVPDREHRGKIVDISTLTKLDYSSWPPKKNFDVTVSIQNPDSRLRPGMSASARIAIERVPDSITIPVAAVFQKAGRNIAYVRKTKEFEEHPIQIGRRSSGRVLVSSGLSAGDVVALRDPTRTEDEGAK